MMFFAKLVVPQQEGRGGGWGRSSLAESYGMPITGDGGTHKRNLTASCCHAVLFISRYFAKRSEKISIHDG